MATEALNFPSVSPEQPEQSIDIHVAPFPARSKQISGIVGGIGTDVSGFYFSDKILVTVSQGGRLAHWVHVPLEPASPAGINNVRVPPQAAQEQNGSSSGVMASPLAHLTASTILGGVGNPDLETMGQLVATQLASALVTRDREERRLLVVGLGLDSAEAITSEQGAFQELIALVKRCL